MAFEIEDVKGLRYNKGVRNSTRRQIVEYLKRRGRSTVDEIARAAGITSMGVRRHLLALENADLVEMELERRPMGRPTHVYHLTEDAEALFPQNYHQLALELLESLAKLDGKSRITELFEQRAEDLWAKYADRVKGKDLLGRVQAVTEIMTESGYMAEWKEAEGGYLIVENNCAITHVARTYPEACICQLELIKHLLGSTVVVTRESHIVSGDTCCVYVVRRKPSRSRKEKRKPGGETQ